MIARVHSSILQGIDAIAGEVAAVVARRRISELKLVGMAQTTVKESVFAAESRYNVDFAGIRGLESARQAPGIATSSWSARPGPARLFPSTCGRRRSRNKGGKMITGRRDWAQMSSTLQGAIVAALMTAVLAPAAVSYADLPPSTPPIWTYQTNETSKGKAAQFGSVYDGQLYVSSYDGTVRQFDLYTGVLQNQWDVTPGRWRMYSAPLMVDDQLYLFGTDNGFYRLDKTATPTVVKLADFTLDLWNTWTHVEALAYDGGTGLFFLGTGPSVRAVDSSGTEHWSVPHANDKWGQPMSNDGYLYTFDTTRKRIYKYRATTGAAVPEWDVPFDAATVNMSKGMDGDGDTLVFAVNWDPDGTTGSITAVYDSGPNAGTKKWEQPLGHSVKHASLWEGHDILVIPAMNGKVEFRRASTGEFLRETATLSGGATPDGVSRSPWSQITISGDYGIVSTMDQYPTLTEDNYLFVIDLNTGRELWRSEPMVGHCSCMSPILSDGIAVVGTYWGSHAWHAYDLGEGDPVEFSRFTNEYNTGNIPGGLTLLTAGAVAGDANLDGKVGIADLVALADHYGQPGGWRDGDLNGDGIVGIADLTIIADNYGRTSGGVVPEPATLSLLAAGGLALIRRGRK